MKINLLFFNFVLVTFCSTAQDTLFLRKNNIVTGQIISADSNKVIMRKQGQPEGPDYIFFRKEIKRAAYADGKLIYFPKQFIEWSAGISTSTTSSSRYPEYSIGNLTFASKQISGSILGRGRIVSFKFDLGYTRIKRKDQVPSYGYYSHQVKSDINSLLGLFCLRFNFSRKIIDPYLSFAYGAEASTTSRYDII